jgi:transposase
MDEEDVLGVMPGSRHGVSPERIRRFEVLTGVGRRRSFAVEEKLALVAQMDGCANISALARQHDLRPAQLFTWRRELRYAAEVATGAASVASAPMFVPAIIDAPVEVAVATPKPRRSTRRRTAGAAVELEIDGVAVRIARGTDAAMIAAVIGALKPMA